MNRAALYRKYLRQAAKEYGCKPSDTRAKLAATRRLTLEVYQAKLISGRDVDPATLRWMLEEEAKYAPPPAPPELELRVVHNIGHCPRCHYEASDHVPPTPKRPPHYRRRGSARDGGKACCATSAGSGCTGERTRRGRSRALSRSDGCELRTASGRLLRSHRRPPIRFLVVAAAILVIRSA
jgi:hypothetical protein